MLVVHQKTIKKGRFSSHSTLPRFVYAAVAPPLATVDLASPAPHPPPFAARNCFRHSLHYTAIVSSVEMSQSLTHSAKWPFSELYIYLQRENKNPIAFIYYGTVKPRPLAARHSAKQKRESERASEKVESVVQLTHTNHDSQSHTIIACATVQCLRKQ